MLPGLGAWTATRGGRPSSPSSGNEEDPETDDEGWDMDSRHGDWREKDQPSNPEDYEDEAQAAP